MLKDQIFIENPMKVVIQRVNKSSVEINNRLNLKSKRITCLNWNWFR